MSKKELKIKFLDKLELFYRNFGSEWTLSDFVTNENQVEFLTKYLIKLEGKGILKVKADGISFTILDLPSNHPELFLSND